MPRPLRVANLGAGLLFLLGAAIYGRAWLGLHGLRSYEGSADTEPFAGMARFNHFWELSRLGIRLVLAALALAVLTALVALLLARRGRS